MGQPSLVLPACLLMPLLLVLVLVFCQLLPASTFIMFIIRRVGFEHTSKLDLENDSVSLFVPVYLICLVVDTMSQKLMQDI